MSEDEEMRIGVNVCHCGSNIAGVLDVEKLVEEAKKMDSVVAAWANMYSCSDSGTTEIQEKIEEHDLNRVVVASCTPRTHAPLFKDTIAEAGVNPYLFVLANIRDQNSWVHAHQPEDERMEKAIDTIKMAVAKVRLLKPHEKITVPVENKKALVIGGGVAGMDAAQRLGDKGFKTYLVERDPSIGGRMAKLDKTFPTTDCSICILGPKMVDTNRHPNVEIISYADVTEVEGWIGNYTVHITKKPRYITEDCTGCEACEEVCPVLMKDEFEEDLDMHKAIYKQFPQAVPDQYVIDMDHCIKCGMCQEKCREEGPDAIDFDMEPEDITLNVDTIVIATGADTYDPSINHDYGYGIYDNVLTTLEFERLGCAGGPTGGKVVRKDGKQPKKIAFIQCVGSRDESEETHASYCCEIGCDNTIKLAFLTLDHMPGTEVDVFYKDMRNKDETMYTRVREMGANFINGTPSEVNEDPETKNLELKFENLDLGKVMRKEYDMVVLQTGMVPAEGTMEVADALPISLNEEGFFSPSHPILKPVQTSQDGMAIAGTCFKPQSIPESVAQARGAVGTVTSPMIKGEFVKENLMAEVDEEACVGCGLCERNCPFGAAVVEEKGEPAKIIEVKCSGCGACAADCPTDAISMRNFTDEQIIAQIHAALENNPEEKILCFICNWCAYAGADFAGVSKIEYPPSSRHIRMMCSARVDTDFIIEAFKAGANQVLIGGCHLPSDCHYMQAGNVLAKKRIDKFRKKLEGLEGFNPDRLRLEWVSATEGQKYANIITEMDEKIPEYKEEAKETAELVEKLQKND